MMGHITEKVSIPKILEAVGVKDIQRVNPFNLDEAVEAVKHAANVDGVSAIIYEAPCINICKPGPMQIVDEDKCTACGKCIRDLGCPAILKGPNGKAKIDLSLCYGCELCTQVCPFDAIGGYEND